MGRLSIGRLSKSCKSKPQISQARIGAEYQDPWVINAWHGVDQSGDIELAMTVAPICFQSHERVNPHALTICNHRV